MVAMAGRALGGIVLVWCSLAAAKPLPPGLTVSLVKAHLMVSRDGVTVPFGTSRMETGKLVSAELSPDGKTISVKVEDCETVMDPTTGPREVPLALVEARIENALGMKLHTQKKYADAITHFTLAVQKDPATLIYATNLLSAQSMGGKLDDADRTLATAGKLAAPWFAWRLAVDPELKAVKARPSAKLAAPKAGTAKGDLHDAIAYSSLGFAATEAYTNLYNGMPDGSSQSELIVVELTSGREVLRLPTVETCSADEMTGKPLDKACAKRLAAKSAAQRKVADGLLAQLGFDVVGQLVTNPDENSYKAPDGRALVIGDKTTITSGKTSKVIEWGPPKWIAWVPKALIEGDKVKNQEDCSGDGFARIELTVVPTP